MGSGGSMQHILGPLQIALGAGATAMGQPEVGVPLLATGVNTTASGGGQAQPGASPATASDPMSSFLGVLGNPALAKGAGAIMQGMQPQQPQPFMQTPPRLPMQPQGPMPSMAPLPPPQMAMPIAPGPNPTAPPGPQGPGPQQLTPQMLAMLMQQRGMGMG